MSDIYVLTVSQANEPAATVRIFSSTDLAVRYLKDRLPSEDMMYIEEHWRDLISEKVVNTGKYRVCYARFKAEYNITTNSVEVRGLIGRQIYDEPILSTESINRIADNILREVYKGVAFD